MKKISRSLFLSLVLLLFCNILVHASSPEKYEIPAIEAGIQSHDEGSLIASAKAMRRSGKVYLDFDEIEMKKFLLFVSVLLQRDFVNVYNPLLKISIKNPPHIQYMSLQEIREITISMLRSISYPSNGIDDGKSIADSCVLFSTCLLSLEVITYEDVIQNLGYLHETNFKGEIICLPVEQNDIVLQGSTEDVNMIMGLIEFWEYNRQEKNKKLINR